jgi:uncharacterized protein (TIGR01244 family)
MPPFRRLTDEFYVAPQLSAEDFAAARAQGIRTVINNRPDGESPDQLADEEARKAAEAAGLDYVYAPTPTGGMTEEHVEAMRAAIAAHEGPFLAYCRSGTRSCHLWAFASARDMPAEDIVTAAAGAGYDLEPAKAMLELLRRQV